MLRIRDLHTHYGQVHALKGISLDVQQGEIVALIGNNGAGKSTLLKTVSGLIRPTSGSSEFLGRRIDGVPSEEIVRLGISQAPEGRRLFPRSSVLENLEMGAYVRKDRKAIRRDIEKLMDRFPILRERENQLAGTLSGGEQQMLAIARSLMSNPTLLLLDEPSLGLAPKIKTRIFEAIQQIKSEGTTTLLVEQDAVLAMDVADNIHVLEEGKIEMRGTREELEREPRIKKVYLGI